MTGQRPEQLIYDTLWNKSASAFDRGAACLDPFIKDPQKDKRCGVTLVARPDAAVSAQVQRFVDEVAGIAPEQYFYHPREFHMTVLSVIPGSEHWKQSARRLPECVTALRPVFQKCPPFSVTFRGVTASPEAVLIQGFPTGDTLTRLRDDLRTALTRCGLGANLDRRYKIATAHLTVVRFSTARKNWKPLKSLLESNRTREFGTCRFSSIQLIEGDWYASKETVKEIEAYCLHP